MDAEEMAFWFNYRAQILKALPVNEEADRYFDQVMAKHYQNEQVLPWPEEKEQ